MRHNFPMTIPDPAQSAQAASGLPASAPERSARYLRVLSIAGSDSGGGAGIQADLKTFSALGCYGMTAIAAITAQNTCGVRAIHAVPAEILKAQIDAVVQDIGVDAVKIGMLATPETVRVVANAIREYQLPHVVLDPVMVATSGDRLVAAETADALVSELFPLVELITPNLDEAGWLLGHPIDGIEALDASARQLLALGAPAVLLKGGHLPGDWVVDLLVDAHGVGHRLESARIVTHNGHGTGCTLSSAIAAELASGAALPEAVARARDYILGAIAAGADVRTGSGHGPLNHGYAPLAQKIVRG